MILPYGQPTLASDGTHARPQERGEDAETDVIGLTTIEVCTSRRAALVVLVMRRPVQGQALPSEIARGRFRRTSPRQSSSRSTRRRRTVECRTPSPTRGRAAYRRSPSLPAPVVVS